MGVYLSASVPYRPQVPVATAVPAFAGRGRAGLHNMLSSRRGGYHRNKLGIKELLLLVAVIFGVANRDAIFRQINAKALNNNDPQIALTSVIPGISPAPATTGPVQIPGSIGEMRSLSPILPFQDYPYKSGLPIREEHFNMLKDISRRMNVDPLWMLAIFLHETAYNPNRDGPYFDPNKGNSAGCKGTIQWCGTPWLGNLSLEEQLPHIENWFKTHTYRTPQTAVDYYLVIFTPAYINETGSVGNRNGDSTKQAVYRHNSGADLDGNGDISALELQRIIGTWYDRLTALYK